MLREDVVEAVARGEFHVYAVDSIDEGLDPPDIVQAGVKYNVIPGEAKLCGTVRAFSDEVRAMIRERMRALCAGMAVAFHVEITADIRDTFGVLVNEEEQSSVVEAVARVERDFEVPGGLRVALDVDKIRRAVSNVAANARDAMGGRGRLHLSARVETNTGADGPGEHLALVIVDEGPGVSPEIRDRVFEPFVTLGKKRGTGLGLAVARRFVEDHGGRLELAPSPLERGARFRLVLPLALRGGGGVKAAAAR
jgi:signal transduction histidine kinase